MNEKDDVVGKEAEFVKEYYNVHRVLLTSVEIVGFAHNVKPVEP